MPLTAAADAEREGERERERERARAVEPVGYPWAIPRASISSSEDCSLAPR